MLPTLVETLPVGDTSEQSSAPPSQLTQAAQGTGRAEMPRAQEQGCSMARNERKTENIVRDELRQFGYYADGSGIIVEEQKSDLPRLQKLLEHASKQGGGAGKPEFLIRSTARPDFIIVIECKASTRNHVSSTLDKYADYAVDGALLYASFLSKEYDVIAIAVSGQNKTNLRISHYIHLRGEDKPNEFPQAREFVRFEDYYQAFIHSEVKFRQDYHALLDFSRKLNNDLHVSRVPEAESLFQKP